MPVAAPALPSVVGLLTLLLCFLALAASAQPPPLSGFISVDCGLADAARYSDPYTQIAYSPDVGYAHAGVNRNVSSDYKMGTLARRYSDLRSFPNRGRNCYTLGPVRRGGRYLVRAGFVYGNYDGLNRPPVFDLYLDRNLWQTVSTADTFLAEIIAIARRDTVKICLVNKRTGTPFISVLELRPLPDSMYTLVNESQSLVLHSREDHGGKPDGRIRYPEDPYDRVWFTARNRTGWTPVSSNAEVKSEAGDELGAPWAVLRTAVRAAPPSRSLNFTVPGGVGEKIYVFMYFTELRQLGHNESREFNVYSNGTLWYGPYRPEYRRAGLLYTDRAGGEGTYTYSLTATGNSTLPPILNALEVYSLHQRSL